MREGTLNITVSGNCSNVILNIHNERKGVLEIADLWVTKEVKKEPAVEERVLQPRGREQFGRSKLESNQGECLDMTLFEVDAKVTRNEALDCCRRICCTDEVQLCFAGALIDDGYGANHGGDLVLLEGGGDAGWVRVIDGHDWYV